VLDVTQFEPALVTTFVLIDVRSVEFTRGVERIGKHPSPSVFHAVNRGDAEAVVSCEFTEESTVTLHPACPFKWVD